MDRLHVRQITDEAFEERDPAGRIDGLEHDAAAGPDPVEREAEHLIEILRLQMLDDLDRDQPTQRFIRDTPQIRSRIRRRRIEAARLADLDHLGVEIEALCGHSVLFQEIKEFTPATTNIEYVRLPFK